MAILLFRSYLRAVEHFVDRVDGDKRRRVAPSDIIHQLTVLVFVHDGDDLPLLLTGIGAEGLVDRSAGMKRIQNKAGDLLFFLREDADPFAGIETKDNMRCLLIIS